MSDYNSSLPVRTENAGDVISKLADATTPSQQLAISSSGEASVKIKNGASDPAGVEVIVSGAAIDPRDIRALTSADVVTAQQGGAPWSQNITEIGGAAPSATNSMPTQLTDGTGFYDARQIRALTNADVVSANIRDASGTAFSASNPLPVTIEEAAGTDVHGHDKAVAVAAGSTSNHDYTVASTNFVMEQVLCSAPGMAKFEVQVAQDGSTFSTVAVRFVSSSDNNADVTLKRPITVVVGGKIRVIKTNRDKQAQDLYDTIEGYQL